MLNRQVKQSKAQIEAGNYAAQLEKESADAQLALQKQIWEKQQADQLPYFATRISGYWQVRQFNGWH